VVFTTKGNVPFAVISVVYAYVHFRAAIFTEKQARQWVNISVPVGSFYRRVFKYALHVFKGRAVNYRRVYVLGYVPFAFIDIVISFIPVMLCGFEIDYIAAILLPCEYAGQGCFVPIIAVVFV
jgi:cell division protein FtsW (lipid II flippase)